MQLQNNKYQGFCSAAPPCSTLKINSLLLLPSTEQISHNYLAQGKSWSCYFFQYKIIIKTFPIGWLPPDLSTRQKDINNGPQCCKVLSAKIFRANRYYADLIFASMQTNVDLFYTLNEDFSPKTNTVHTILF